MRPGFRYLITAAAGVAIGLAAAVQTVRAGALGSGVAIGPWRSGADFGTADASARTRAIVALSGLLALPAREARYYTAAADDAGAPLDGRCTYLVSGGPLPSRWWSLTLYDDRGYLAGAGPYSVESGTLAREEAERARSVRPPAVIALPRPVPGQWSVAVLPRPTRLTSDALPTAGLGRFQLTLRLYLPVDGGRGDPPRAVLPAIRRERC